VLKVHVNTLKHNQELEVYRYLAGVTNEHTGWEYIRRLKDSFTLKSYNGEHNVFIMTPLGISLRTLQEMQKNGIFQQTLVVGALKQVLTGLNFLHKADVIHTGKYIPSLSSTNAILPSDQQTIRPPLRQSAYCPYERFYPRQGRRRRNPHAIGKEAS
jgi:hypothetical protein